MTNPLAHLPVGLHLAGGNKWLNVGCGSMRIPGFYNTDLLDYPGIDEQVDLTHPLPWIDFSWDFIYASHVLEHLDDLFPVVQELLRVSKNRAIWEIHSPVGREALECIGHQHVVSDITFRSWFQENYEGSSFQVLGKDPPGHLKIIQKFYSRDFRLGPISGYHTRKYLGMEIGRKSQLVLVMRVIK